LVKPVIVRKFRFAERAFAFAGTSVSAMNYIITSKVVLMDDDPKDPAPEIMPPLPKEEPEQTPTEIPPDKDVPQKESPLRASDGAR
jgi:hypothetical protein